MTKLTEPEMANPNELRRRLDSLERAIETLESSGAEIPPSLATERYSLTRQIAVARDAALIPVSGSPDVSTAFIIMPFRDPFNSYYSEIIKPAVVDCGYEAVRSDEVYSPGAFVQTIWNQILGSAVVIAEMTGANSNVLYELGLSHAIDRRVVMITQKIEDVPADLRHINCVVYDTANGLGDTTAGQHWPDDPSHPAGWQEHDPHASRQR